MPDIPEYCATDLARHVVDPDDLPPRLRPDPPRPMAVAELIHHHCLVGYGGHYHERLPGENEEDLEYWLEEHLIPMYLAGAAPERPRDLLDAVWQEHAKRLIEAGEAAMERWK